MDVGVVAVVSVGRSRQPRPAAAGAVAKRAFDLVVGVPLCLLAVPVVLGLALVLAVRHGTNPLFVHDRVGHGGRLISIPKLRTLAPGTPRYADKTVVLLQPLSRFARALRRRHLDELPQLLLVVTGRLSLVGPRPRMAVEVAGFGDPRYDEERLSVPQGCTGLWQISPSNGTRVSDHPAYDRFYIANRTVRLDAWIVWRTLVQGLGAHPVALVDVPRWTLRPTSPGVLADVSR